MNRLQQILLAILVVQIVVTGVVYMPKATAAQSGPLLANFKTEDVKSISMDDYDKNHVTIVRDGKDWKYVLQDGGLYPADGAKADTLLKKVADIKANRLVTKTATSHKQLKVSENDFVRKVVLEMNDGTKYTFYAGTQPGGGTVHIRMDGQNEVYLAGGLESNDFGSTPAIWVDTAYINEKSDTLTSISVKNTKGTMGFVKNASGKWAFKDAPDKPLDLDKFEPAANHVAELRMTTPLGQKSDPAYQLDSPQAVVTFTVKKDSGEKTYTLQIGAKDTQRDAYYVKYSESPYYAMSESFFVEDWATKSKEDFIAQPTPTPAAGAPADPGA
ncbi:MAG: DUF4340 domain-containing protein, partial [Chloroflexota bacterium]